MSFSEIKLLIIFMFCNIILSCKDKPERIKTNRKNVAQLSFDRNIDLKLDSLTPNDLYSMELVKDSHEEICLLNNPSNSLQFYDLNGNLTYKLPFPKSGPKTVGRLQGFGYVNSDTIYILTTQNTVAHVNRKGDIIKKYSISKPSLHTSIPWSENGVQIVFDSPNLYIPCNPGEYYDNDRTQFYGDKSRLCIVLNTIDGSIKEQAAYPNKEYFIKNNFPPLSILTFSTYNPNTSKFIYSFGSDDFIYQYDNMGNNISNHFAGSESFNQILPMKESLKHNESIECIRYYMNNNFFSKVFYDKYRNVYYRLVKRAFTDNLTKQMLLKNEKIKYSYSCLILDKDLNIIGESLLPEDITSGYSMLWKMATVSKDGFLVQTRTKDENILRLSLLKLKI